MLGAGFVGALVDEYESRLAICLRGRDSTDPVNTVKLEASQHLSDMTLCVPPSRNTPWEHLEHLTLPFKWHLDDSIEEQWPFPGLRLDECAPDLISLSLSVVVNFDEISGRDNTRTPSIGICHQSLRDLKVEIPAMLGYVVDAFLRLVQDLSHLKTLSLNISDLPDENIDNSEPVIAPFTHPGIHSLSLF